MRANFRKEMDRIKKMILSLGAMVEERVHLANQCIGATDAEVARKVMQSDHEIDAMEVEIEEECLKVIALHQPVAVDLRFLVAVIKINNDLERIGDQAVNVAQRVISIAGVDRRHFYFDYTRMAEKAKAMLNMSLDALVNLDIDIACRVLQLDDEVDDIKGEAYDRIKTEMSSARDDMGYLINLLLISRHLERVADHATNISEEIIYMIEGEIVRHGKY